MTEKDDLRARLARGMAKEKSYAEKKRQREQSRARKAEREETAPRRTNWLEEDEAAHARSRPSAKRDRPRATSGREAELEQALVVALSSGRARVRLGAHELDVALAPALRAAQQTEIAVGDAVLVERRALVRTVLERRTRLARPDPGAAQRERVLAANVDQALIVASIAKPELKPGLVDRVLLALARSGVHARLVVTKWDLATREHERALDEALAPWSELDVARVSVRTRFGLVELRTALDGRRSVLVGHSGVGKSSLVNALAPEAGLATGAVSALVGKGRHTTTRAQLVELWPGAELIDTPGVRQFGLWRVERGDVRAHFTEFAEHAVRCRFADCSHHVEPECAVREAVEAGVIARSRFALYARLWSELTR